MHVVTQLDVSKNRLCTNTYSCTHMHVYMYGLHAATGRSSHSHERCSTHVYTHVSTHLNEYVGKHAYVHGYTDVYWQARSDRVIITLVRALLSCADLILIANLLCVWTCA